MERRRESVNDPKDKERKMTKQDDEKKAEGNVELSLDELEGAAGGVILETEDGRYVTMDEFNG